MPAIVRHQSAGRIPLGRNEPDEAFPLQVPLKFIPVEVLQPCRGKEGLDVSRLILTPTFNTKGPSVGQDALPPTDVQAIVFGSFYEIGDVFRPVGPRMR